jgi:hemoglobin
MSDAPSLYERLGGDPAVRALVDAFYARVLADADLAPFFARVPLDRLRTMQHEFFCAALGGPLDYSGRSIALVHYGRGIERRHFARFVGHLLATLRDRGLDEADADAVVRAISAYAPEVLGEGTNAG